jgi:arylsulfatase A-like enzyme
VDQQRALFARADFGCYGGAYPIGAKTPNIDQFAAESLLLTNYNVEAQCTPSRSALMTGRHPVRTGCITALPGSGLVAWEVTIADKLKELGYSNAIFGKWHCGEEVGRLPTDKGFDYWYGPPGTSCRWFNTSACPGFQKIKVSQMICDSVGL